MRDSRGGGEDQAIFISCHSLHLTRCRWLSSKDNMRLGSGQENNGYICNVFLSFLQYLCNELNLKIGG